MKKEADATGRHRAQRHVVRAFALSNRIYFVKLLPNLIKSAAMLKVIKNRLKTALISEALYRADEFMAHNIIGTI